MSSPTLTRKDIALAANCSVKTVKRRHKKWGLDKCLAQDTGRPRFVRSLVNQQLIARGIIEAPI